MRWITLALLLTVPATSWADSVQPPWLQPHVIRAAVAIELNESQAPQFRDAVTDLINNQTKATNRLLQRNNVANLERKIKSANNRQFKKMDRAMSAFLSQEQMLAYAVYRKELHKSLQDWVLQRGRGSDDSLAKTKSAITNEGFAH